MLLADTTCTHPRYPEASTPTRAGGPPVEGVVVGRYSSYREEVLGWPCQTDYTERRLPTEACPFPQWGFPLSQSGIACNHVTISMDV